MISVSYAEKINSIYHCRNTDEDNPSQIDILALVNKYLKLSYWRLAIMDDNNVPVARSNPKAKLCLVYFLTSSKYCVHIRHKVQNTIPSVFLRSIISSS